MTIHQSEHILQCNNTRNQIILSIEDIKKASKEVAKQIRKVIENREELGFKVNIGGTTEGEDESEEYE